MVLELEGGPKIRTTSRLFDWKGVSEFGFQIDLRLVRFGSFKLHISPATKGARFDGVELCEAAAVTVRDTASIRDVMLHLQETAHQVALVVGKSGHLLGLITDGDIRRGLLASLTLDDFAVKVMNPNFHSVLGGYDPTVTRALMLSHGIRHLPVVDREGRPLAILIDSPNLNLENRLNEVVVMAGGKGTRLFPLTNETPKPMLAVGGIPILEIILQGYAAQGFRSFTIVVGHLGHQIMEHFGDGSRLGVRISYVSEDEPLGTAGSLGILNFDSGEPIVVSNADVLSSIDLGSLIEHHRKGDFALTVAARRQLLKVPYGVLELSDSSVIAWKEKPEIPIQVSAGIYVIDQNCLKLLSSGYSDIPDLVSRLIEDGWRVGSFFFDGLWIDVGTHDSLSSAVKLGSLLRNDWT